MISELREMVRSWRLRKTDEKAGKSETECIMMS